MRGRPWNNTSSRQSTLALQQTNIEPEKGPHKEDSQLSRTPVEVPCCFPECDRFGWPHYWLVQLPAACIGRHHLDYALMLFAQSCLLGLLGAPIWTSTQCRNLMKKSPVPEEGAQYTGDSERGGIILYYIVLYYIMLYYIISYYIVLYVLNQVPTLHPELCCCLFWSPARAQRWQAGL